jgi:bleomycin hydrolase
MRSLLEDTPVMFDCDVGYDQDKKLGIMAEGLYDYNSIYGVDLALTKAQRALLRNSTRNHGMVLVGVDVRDGKAVKWRVENSWGDETGSKGYWTMYDGWFDLYVYSIIVKKKYVPEEVLQIYQQPAVVLPPWDPMLGR